MTRIIWAATLVLVSAGPLLAQDSPPSIFGPPPSTDIMGSPPSTDVMGSSPSMGLMDTFQNGPQGIAGPDFNYGQPSRIWATAEYLLWWTKGQGLPPLVTSSPPGTPQAAAGVLGANGTSTIFGNDRVNTNARSGGRITLGTFLDDERLWGVEGSFFMLQTQSTNFSAGSDGSQIISRPFFNTQTGRQDAELVAFPGVISGRVNVQATSDSLLGAGILGRRALCYGQDCTGNCGYRIDGLFGYRYLHLGEGLGVQENLTSTSQTGQVPFGTNLLVTDTFRTNNNFHGADLGLAGLFGSGRWSLSLQGKLAVGTTVESVTINGSTTITQPGGGATTSPGGLLAQSTNSGRHAESYFSLVPQLDASLNYRLTQNIWLTGGYTFLYWTNIARPGAQVDSNVNPGLLPPPTGLGSGGNNPAFGFNHTDFWAQGLSVGMIFRY